ncbi:VOC family protein [Flagellimonas allohymeniacidonis]|uniref:VOC family protein n=1 Tax=Flagellimonas allohymeniacidonis TaxID=2517819 RepID=A0A4Q8QIB4_9FLAO|nr:VOC family protein [Allomuricauda hymeniacidonis]TAI48139.1 VOC family protein [Allomuricauda hymeniacidonis]
MNLNQITVPALDLEKSITFYQTLGLQLIVKASPRYARFACPEGGSTFSIHLVEDLPQGNGVMVYFECTQLDDKVQELVTQGISFDEMPEDRPWLWREARLKDPNGNQIILFYAGENRLNPPWRLKESP